jgi:hypothetical protein
LVRNIWIVILWAHVVGVWVLELIVRIHLRTSSVLVSIRIFFFFFRILLCLSLPSFLLFIIFLAFRQIFSKFFRGNLNFDALSWGFELIFYLWLRLAPLCPAIVIIKAVVDVVLVIRS